jgi:predicted secreted protein
MEILLMEVFLITSFEQAGEYNGEETYSLTLESSGTVVFSII